MDGTYYLQSFLNIFLLLCRKVTVFDFSEIMERTEKRVGDEVLGAGPQSVDELRAIARRVKSKYLLRIQSKEKHMVKKSSPQKQLPSFLPTRESTKNVTSAVMGGVGGFATMFKASSSTVSEETNKSNSIHASARSEENASTETKEEIEIQYTDVVHSLAETEQKSTEPNDPEDVLSEAFDLLGGDFSTISAGDIDHSDQELLDSMDVKLDPAAAFTIDDDV